MNAATLALPAPDRPDPLAKIRAFWRYRRSFLAVFLGGLAATFALALLLPPTYQAAATILIEQQEIPQDLVRSAISSFADERIQVISQRVMTTQNLLGLIERYNLYPELRISKPREVLLQRMRDDIAMKMISADVIDPRSGRPTQATIAFSVSYKNHSPELALKVANDLTSLYLNENLTSRTQMAEQTTSFFADEAARQEAHIAELDKRLSDFKQKHQDELPDLTQLNLQESQRVELDLRDAENRIAALDSQKVLLEAQLAQVNPTLAIYNDTGQRVFSAEDRLKALKSQLASYKARYAPDHPDVLSTEREIKGLEAEVAGSDATGDLARKLEEARGELGRAQQKYAPDHPDVLRLKHTVAELEKEIAAAPPPDTRAQARAHADNPAYLQIRGQLDAVVVDREAAVKKRDELKEKLDDYERRLAKAPAVERDFRELGRDLDSAQLKYQQLRAKQGEVQVSQHLETEHKGERFTLIEPPLPPEKPISPNRFLILALGLVLSVGAGGGAAALRERTDPAVRDAGELRALLTVAPLAVIPKMVTPGERRRRRRRRIATWVAVVVGTVAALALVNEYVRPLDVLWAGILRRFGV